MWQRILVELSIWAEKVHIWLWCFLWGYLLGHGLYDMELLVSSLSVSGGDGGLWLLSLDQIDWELYHGNHV